MAIFFPGMIADIAKEAGIKTPPKPDADFDREKYPHFVVFCEITLGRAIQPSSWREWARGNAAVIAKLSEKRIKEVMLGNLVDLGVELSCF